MPGAQNPGPLGAGSSNHAIDEGTLALTATPEASPVGVNPSTAASGSGTPAASAGTNDPEIEALDLSETARKAAYALKKAHPSISFTSGRRNKAEQASAMAGNVVKNRKWIEQTYAKSDLSTKCQQWVDDNPDSKTQAEIAEGLTAILEEATDAELGRLSKHLSGDAFDVQPVEKDADAIKKTIRGLPGLGKFLEVEGGLVRWHAQF